MKQYSKNTNNTHIESLFTLKNTEKKVIEDSIMDSKTFASEWEPYIRDIGLTKEAKGKKYYRSQEYASIGVMDRNDLIQEAYTCFFEAWEKVDWDKVNSLPEAERQPFLWGWVKKTVVRRVHDSLLALKDGIRVPHRELYYESYKDRKATRENANIHNITSLFNQLDVLFIRNQEDTALTKHQTDLLGYFLESHMDDFLDLNFKGERNPKGIERMAIMSFYGIDSIRMTVKEIAETFKVSESTIKNVIKRAQKKLRCEESKELISEFCKEYFIETQADIN